MPLDIDKLLELEKRLMVDEKRRLGLLRDSDVQHGEPSDCKELEKSQRESENGTGNYCRFEEPKDSPKTQTCPVVERLDLSSCHDDSLERSKQAFIETLEKSANPLTSRSNEGSYTMLRYGEYSPNNPLLRFPVAPFLGIGEYDQRKKLILQRRHEDYKEHLARKNGLISDRIHTLHAEHKSDRAASFHKAVQTDIQNINSPLVQYELHSQKPPEKELNPALVDNTDSGKMYGRYDRIDGQRPESGKLRGILTNRRSDSSQERLISDHSYVPSIMDGFSYQDRNEVLARERMKRETYQAELLQQIEDKQRQIALQKEREKFEDEMENRRLEQQCFKLHEEQLRDEERRTRMHQTRRCSEDLSHYVPAREQRFRKYSDSESNVTSLRNTAVASKSSSYSPPTARKPYSFNVPSTSSRYTSSYYDTTNWRDRSLKRDYYFGRSDTLGHHHHQQQQQQPPNHYEPRSRSNSFNRYETRSLNRYESMGRLEPRPFHRYDSLGRMDSLSISDGVRPPRLYSATQRLDRSSCSKLDDPLPIPVLKARSPVAKDLKRSVAIDSSKHGSEAVRKLEDRWQVPAVQKNILSKGDGQNRSILTQLGAIRMQLQQEQLRMDETLRNRGISKNKAVQHTL